MAMKRVYFKKYIKKIIRRFQGNKEMEYFDYYSMTSHFILKNTTQDSNVLSVGCRLNQLLPMSHFYKNIIHVTSVPIQDLDNIEDVLPISNLRIIIGDFFNLDYNLFPSVDTLISQATIHCMSDSRYFNEFRKSEPAPYRFARKLIEICPNIKRAAVSIAVNREENIEDNYTWLNEKKFLASFEKAGFECIDRFYDINKPGGGIRFSLMFPDNYATRHSYIIGNYFFIRKEIPK